MKTSHRSQTACLYSFPAASCFRSHFNFRIRKIHPSKLLNNVLICTHLKYMYIKIKAAHACVRTDLSSILRNAVEIYLAMLHCACNMLNQYETFATSFPIKKTSSCIARRHYPKAARQSLCKSPLVQYTDYKKNTVQK